MENGGDMGMAISTEAAERLARAGAISPNVLLGLYTERKAAASGGVGVFLNVVTHPSARGMGYGRAVMGAALNWVRSRRGVTSILLGARTESQLLDNLGAVTWSLSEDEIDSLDRASQVSLRYPVSAQYSYGAERNPPVFKRFG